MFTGSFLILLCWHFAALPPDVARCASTSALRPNQPSRNAFRKRINKRTSTAHISRTSMASVAVLHVLRTAHCARREQREFPSPAALFEMQPADGTSVFLLLCFCQGNSNNCSIQLQLWQPNIQVFQLHSLVCRGHRK